MSELNRSRPHLRGNFRSSGEKIQIGSVGIVHQKQDSVAMTHLGQSPDICHIPQIIGAGDIHCSRYFILRDTLILLTQLWDFSPTWTNLFDTKDYHASDAETSLLLHWCPEVVRPEIVMDEPEVAERLRQDPDSYQLRESFTNLKQEIIQTSQRSDVKVGVMGYPERACAETGKKIEAEFLENAVPAIKQAIADADEARKTGKRIIHADNVHLKIRAV